MAEQRIVADLGGLAGEVQDAAVRWFEKHSRRFDHEETHNAGLELSLTVGTAPQVVEVRIRTDVSNPTDAHVFDVAVQFHFAEGAALDTAGVADFVRHHGAPTVVGLIRAEVLEAASTFELGRLVLPFHIEAFIADMPDEQLAGETQAGS